MSTPKAKILHVDDDDANRYAVTRTLVRAGFDVTEATTGNEALKAAEDKPDLIILDVRLPDIDGFEVCRRIKRQPATSQIPVLHLSASRVTSEDKAFGLDGGAEGYLIRPVEPVELVATVNALLRAKRTEAALQEKEEQFRALLAGVREYAIFAADVTGRITSWHDGATRLLGYDADAAVGLPFEQLFPAEDRVTGVPEQELAIAAGGGEFNGDRVLVRQNGTRFDASVVLTATRSADGTLLGFLTLLQDISARKRTETARERQFASEQAARLEAERVGRMKDEFLATLGHEIRTPLNAILGWSQIMQSPGTSADDVRQGLEVIERNARAQAQIINDLLEMSRIISGKIRLDVKALNVADVVRASIDSVMPAANAKGIRIRIDDETSDATVQGDANRLQQVYWNLLSNAIKFTPVGGDIRVRLRRHEATFEVAVVDSGDGIDASFLPHVFDRFRQADSTITRRHGGLGIGLSIVKQLVEGHGGSVSASSAGPGGGAEFAVVMPLAGANPAPETSDGHPPVTQPVAPAAVLPSLHGLRVLVLDDEADARGLLARLLGDRQAAVRVADSVATALECLRNEPFDVLVSDIGMPDEDGYSLIRRIRADDGAPYRDLPAIALTAYARGEDRDKAIAAGFNDHVSKPVETVDLINAVARVVGREGLI